MTTREREAIRWLRRSRRTGDRGAFRDAKRPDWLANGTHPLPSEGVPFVSKVNDRKRSAALERTNDADRKRARRLPSPERPAGSDRTSSRSSSSADTTWSRSRAPRVSTWSAARVSTRRSPASRPSSTRPPGPRPTRNQATAFFTASARNLQRAGAAAGAKRIVVVSIIGIDKFHGGYNAAKMAQEQTLLEGPLPVRIVRAAQFHEFVEPLIGWTIQDGVAHVPEMRTQLVAARVVAEALADAAEEPEIENGRITEIAGPRAERLADVAAALFASRGDSVEIRESRERCWCRPATRTPRPTRRAPRCPTRARSSPARASRSGWRRLDRLSQSGLRSRSRDG